MDARVRRDVHAQRHDHGAPRMTAAAASPLSHQPRFGDATPIALLPLHHDGDPLSQLVRDDVGPLEPVGDGIGAARIDVPPGEWMLWSDPPSAVWIGDRVDALPEPVRSRLMDGSASDVVDMIDWFASVGVWCREASVLLSGGWTPPQRADVVLPRLASGGARALSGVFIDRDGRSTRLHISPGRVFWADRPAVAVEWVLLAANLTAPT